MAIESVQLLRFKNLFLKKDVMSLLSGIRIIDFSKYLPGPYATMRLADKGAEVIVIEPLEGEPSRHLGLKKEGTGLLYLANNRNKKSVALNLKSEKGKSIALQLIKQADVLVESFRPSVMRKLGLDYEVVKTINPSIVYCSISGYGQQGEVTHLGSHDLNYLAVSGVLGQLSCKTGQPIIPSIQLADHLGAYQCCEEILAALFKRNTTNEGSYIDISLIDSLVSIMGTNYVYYQYGNKYKGVPQLAGDYHCYTIYETKDHRYLALAALEYPFWNHFCVAVEREDWLSFHELKINENETFTAEITELFKSKTFDEWIKFALAVDCCMAPVLQVHELSENVYVKERNLIDQTKIATYFKQNLNNTTEPPSVGVHTKELLMSLLHYSEDEIVSLDRNNVIRI